MESQHRKEMDRLQERLDSTVKRYEGELGRLRDEQDRLRTNLRDKSHAIKSEYFPRNLEVGIGGGGVALTSV